MSLEGQTITALRETDRQLTRLPASGSPFLTREEEVELCDAWRTHKNYAARNKVIMAHLPLAMRLISRRKGGRDDFSREDLQQEAMIGLMQAMDLFDTSKGFRFSTYARWWIRSRLREASFNFKSVVTPRQSLNAKRVQDNFGKAILQEEILARNRGEDLLPLQIRMRAAHRIGVPADVAEETYRHVSSGDTSLNRKASKDDENATEVIDLLADESPDAQANLEEVQKNQRARELVVRALLGLKPRERDIILSRYLSESRETLETLSDSMGVSRERIRQIEVRGLEKILAFLKRDPVARRDLVELFGLS